MRNVPILASDGRALIVALDHARTHGAIEGLEDPVPDLIAGGPRMETVEETLQVV